MDDDDDVAEGEHESMLIVNPAVSVAIGPAETTLGGIGKGDSWKIKNVTRTFPTKESDTDGTKSRESHPIKVWKSRGERVKITPSVDEQPWVKVEHVSNQDSILESPSAATRLIDGETDGIQADCILPFLRQLHAATPSGGPCLRACSSFHEREVWTCGQNSYGELGHSDTGTRKTHCLVKPFEGREVVDVAAGKPSSEIHHRV